MKRLMARKAVRAPEIQRNATVEVRHQRVGICRSVNNLSILTWLREVQAIVGPLGRRSQSNWEHSYLTIRCGHISYVFGIAGSNDCRFEGKCCGNNKRIHGVLRGQFAAVWDVACSLSDISSHIANDDAVTS